MVVSSFSKEGPTNLFRNGGHKDSPALGEMKYCGRETPILPESSSNRVYISYHAIAGAPGVILNYEEVSFACRYDIQLRNKSHNFTISSPNYPQPPSTSHISCVWIVTAPPGESVHLDFVLRFDIKRSLDCSVEYVEVRDGGTELSPLIGRYCNKTPTPKVTLGRRMYIKYFTDADSPNNGFKAVVKIATCGGTYFDQSKMSLLSPQYPKRYPANTDCLWRIVGFNADTQLYVNVSELYMSDDSDCSNAQDYLEFISVDPITKNMTDSPPPTRLCGRHSILNGTSLVPPSISNEMYIRFHSGPRDSSSSHARFAFFIEPRRERCLYKMIAPSGIFTSPGYPNPMPQHNELFCTWVITVPEGHRVSIKFLDYDLEPSLENTLFDYKLTFHDGESFFITSFSSNSSWTNLVVDSFTNEMRIHYIESSISGAHRGFKAEFSSDKPTICGGQLEDQGSLSFSLLGQNAKYYYCEWRNSRDPMLSNQTTFTVTVNGTFNNMTKIVCPVYGTTYDSLIIQDSRSMILETVCENTTSPVMVRSPFPGTVIKARRRGSYGRQHSFPVSLANFTLTYKTDQCGGIVHGPQAVITSPGYPNKYPANIDCAWNVKFQQDSQVHYRMNKDLARVYGNTSQLGIIRITHMSPSRGASFPGHLLTLAITPAIPSPLTMISIRDHFWLVYNFQLNSLLGTAKTNVTLIWATLWMSRSGTSLTANVEILGFMGNSIDLVKFEAVDLDPDCSKDFLRLYNGENQRNPHLIPSLCGNTVPRELRTQSNFMFLEFHSGPTNPSHKGFRIILTQDSTELYDIGFTFKSREEAVKVTDFRSLFSYSAGTVLTQRD
ncbi:hypothetical protein J6590_068210 [Homalodisca vitripennis]|nr:hypothetical protein J6590_068210 [Homalodisca vitripennis]